MKLFKISLHMLVLTAVAACSGNDANKCKVTALDSGDVRVRCPGQPELVLPAGTDGSAGPVECELISEPGSGREELVCNGQSVELKNCAGGLAGDIFLGTRAESEAAGFSDFDELLLNLEYFEANDCQHLIGSVFVTASSASLYPEVLRRLVYAGEVVVVEDIEPLELPALTAAQISFRNAPNSASKLSLPAFEDGGFSITEGSVEGLLELPNFTSGILNIAGVSGLQELRLPNLRSGSVWISDQDALEVIDLPLLQFADQFVFEHLPSLRELSAPRLEFTDRVRIADVPALTSLDISGLVHVPGRIELHRFGSVTSLDFPNLETAGAFTIEQPGPLQLVRADKLEGSLTDFWVESSGSDSSEPLDIILPRLESAGVARLSNANLRTLDMTAFTGITNWPSSMQAANFLVSSAMLEIVRLPNLRNTGLYVTMNGTPGVPVEIDLTNFYFDAVDSTNVLDGNALRVRSTASHSVKLKMDNVDIRWLVEIESLRFAEPFTPGPNISGTLMLVDIPTGSNIDLSENPKFRRMVFANVGTAQDPYFLRVLSPALNDLHVSDGNLSGADLVSANGADLVLSMANGGKFEGDVELDGTTTANANRTFRLYESFGSIKIGRLSTGGLSRISLYLNDVSLQAIEMPEIIEAVVSMPSIELTSLSMPKIERLTAVDFNFPAMPISGLNLNPVPQPAITAQFTFAWAGLSCPTSLFALLPNSTFLTGCSPP